MGGVGDEGSSISTKFVNNEGLTIDAEPLTAVYSLEVAENIGDSDDAPSKQDEVALIDHTTAHKAQNRRVSASSKAAGKRKQTAESSEREPRQKVRKVDPDIHEFPSAKELKDSADCHFVVAHGQVDRLHVVSAAKIQLMINLADIVLVKLWNHYNRGVPVLDVIQTPKVLLLAWEKFFEIKHREKQHPPEDIQELIRKLLEDVQNISEELAEYINSPSWNRPAFYFDDDDDEESSILVRDIISKLPLCVAITPDLPITDSLIMGDEHLDTIPKMESDELIKSSDENLFPIPSESEDFSVIKILPVIESLLNRDTLMASSPKIDSLFVEFAGELITIPPRIVNREHEEYISLMERLLYDNSSPRPPEDFQANPCTIIESLPTFPIPVEDSDSLREEIDIFPGPDDSIPPGIESDDYDSEGDDNSTSLPEFESFHVDYPDLGDSTIDVVEDIPVDVPNRLAHTPHTCIYFDSFLPIMISYLILMFLLFGDRNKNSIRGYALSLNPQISATLSPVIDTLLPFSSKNEDKVFNHGVLASKEKSPPSSSHRGFKASKLFHHKSPMLIHGENIPILDVPFLHFYPP
ncbi:hypothetical protein Tco_0552796 [Tanacetum coccineum]